MAAVRIVFKVVLLAVALLVGQVAGGLIAGLLLHVPVPAMPHDGPFDLTQALGLMTLAYALVLSRFAARLRGGFGARMGTLFAVLYAVGTLLSVIETIYFKAYVKLPPFLVGQMALTGLTQAIIAAPVAAALWRGAADEADGQPDAMSGLWWRLPLIAAIYIVVYFGAGALIAWQGPQLRAYYDQAAHINQTHLALLQFGRGLIWAGLAWMSVRSLKGAYSSRAVITGLVFAVIMVMPLLFPNPYMPWDVRRMHFLEIFTSNLLFGVLASWILLSGVKAKKA